MKLLAPMHDIMTVDIRTGDGPCLPGPVVDVLLPGLDGVSGSGVTVACQIPVQSSIGSEEPEWYSSIRCRRIVSKI